ncbi:MAG: putative membrane protein YkoI [Francisellaceae bacterium]|jgi:uncharacterized membrane protein YkoI
MKKRTLQTMLLSSLAVICFSAQAESNDALLAAQASISAYDAMSIAQKNTKGTVSKVEFEQHKDKTYWEVELVSAEKKTYEFKIDATSGKVLKKKIDEEDDD